MILEKSSTFSGNSLAKARKKEIIDEILKENDTLFPIEIFSYGLSPLEAITFYLKDYKNFKISQIAEHLNKNSAAISLAYKNSTKKNIVFEIKESKFFVPLRILGENGKAGLSISEITTLYLLESGLSISQIADIKSKDVKTIWTFWNRGRKKLKKFGRSSIGERASTQEKSLERKTKEELLEKIEEERSEKVPISIFGGSLTPLESITKFLLEREGKSQSEICELLHKNKSAISLAYKKSKSKKLRVTQTNFDVPILYFSNNSNLSLTEAVCRYLREKGRTNSQIGKLLNVDKKTVHTFYKRSQLKMEAYNEK